EERLRAENCENGKVVCAHRSVVGVSIKLGRGGQVFPQVHPPAESTHNINRRKSEANTRGLPSEFFRFRQKFSRSGQIFRARRRSVCSQISFAHSQNGNPASANFSARAANGNPAPRNSFPRFLFGNLASANCFSGPAISNPGRQIAFSAR